MRRFIIRKHVTNNEKAKLNRLKRQCKFAINTLSQLHKQHQTTHCVLVIGQPESGKSILCASSGKLLFSTQTPLGDEPDFAFEIYLQHHTLFLNIPHEFFLFGESHHQQLAWQILAAQLKKQCYHLPVTRCLITIDLYDFLTRSNISNDTRLSQIALALNIIANKLKRPLDISFFFTKADLISGFSEFFSHESKEFLEQTWGISLISHDAETINTECEQLIKKLNDRLLWCLHHEIHVEHLHLIKLFPLAMETIKHKLTEILPDFFTQWDKNKFLKPAHLYFVSCRQFKELTESSHSDSVMTKQNSHPHLHKHFFIQKALENLCQYHIITRHSYLDKITKISFIVLCTLILVAFIFYTAERFSQHIALLQTSHQTLTVAKNFSKKPYSSLKSDEVAEELENISLTLQALEATQQASLIEKWIFTRDTQLETQLQNMYQRIISQQWLPLVHQQLESYINSHLSSDPANAYIAFTIYLMLREKDWPIDMPYINAHLADLLSASNSFIPFLSENIQKNGLVVDETSSFVENTRAAFHALPTEKLAYIILFSTLDTHNTLNLSTALEPSLEIEKQFSSIPEIYTRSLFSSIYKKRLLSIATEAIHGNKVLGSYENKSISEHILLQKLKEEYLQSYATTWEQAIKHINITPAHSFADFSAQLKILTNVNSPILSLLELSHTNTLIPQIEQISPFLTAFNDTLTPQSTPENSALYHSFAFFIKLNDQIQKLQPCVLLAKELAATSENPTDIQQIRYLATQLPEPIQTWWLQLADNYAALLKQNAVDC